MLQISDKIKALPKRQLKKWIKSKEGKDSQDWKDELAKLKERLDVKRVSTESEKD